MAGRRPETSDREILRIFDERGEHVLSTVEVSDILSYTQGGTYKRLTKLESAGVLNSKSLGNANAWWITSEGKDFLESGHEFVSDWQV